MRWILVVLSLPALVISWLFVTLLCICQLAHKPTFEPGPILSAQWRPWFAKYWRFSNGFGRATIYQHSAISGGTSSVARVRAHEGVHIRQTEDDMVKAFLVGLVAGLCAWNLWVFIGIWCSGIIWIMVHYLASMLRYGWGKGYFYIYKNAEHERAAYAETDTDIRGNSWLGNSLK
jgi:hypothetical protein